MKRTYEEMPPISRAEAAKAFKSDKTDDIVRALIRLALNDSDWRWVQGHCLSFLKHKDRWVRGAAAISLGHLARIHGQLDLDVVIPELERLSTDPKMDGKAQDALDDIRTHVGNR
ncbi:MAG: hypothetical protein KGL74_03660 [Elusimicrobia bacterium]|nr:hypothetical protein [Elusimicrobiota bacterium]